MAEQNYNSFVGSDEAQVIKQIIEARLRRTTMFGSHLFVDPAWDVMLALYLAKLEGQGVAPPELGHKTNVPHSTLARWIDTLECDGWVWRKPHPTDDRRVFIEISSRGLATMRDWLREWLNHSSKRTEEGRVTDLLTRLGLSSS